eukprot:Clim_evm99s11 gene=Clim_evmTU99s11
MTDKETAISYSPKPLRIAVLGPAGAGKTSLLTRLMEDKFLGKPEHTIEDIFEVKYTKGNTTHIVLFLDTIGSNVAEAAQTSYIMKAHGVLLVCDSTTDDIALLSLHKRMVKLRGSDIPCLTLATKSDLPAGDEHKKPSISGTLRVSAKDNTSKEILALIDPLLGQVIKQECKNAQGHSDSKTKVRKFFGKI